MISDKERELTAKYQKDREDMLERHKKELKTLRNDFELSWIDTLSKKWKKAE